MATTEITAVVCTHNRAAYLEMCLRSLLRQTLDRSRFEVVVVNNASSDNTSGVCAPFLSQGAIRYVEDPVVGLSQARNTGWKMAAGRFVGYLDDDATAVPGWLESALSAFQVAPQPAWVGGPIDLDWPGTPPLWLDEVLQESLGRLDWGSETRWLTANERLGGGNSFYPREWLERLGGFDTSLGRKGNLLLSGEETQLQRRIEAEGGRLYYHPGVRILHAVPPERLRPSFFYRRYYWGGRTDVAIQRTLRMRGVEGGNLPSARARNGDTNGDRVGRAFRHLRRAFWLGGTSATRVQSRVYLSYALGYLAGGILHRLRRPRAED